MVLIMVTLELLPRLVHIVLHLVVVLEDMVMQVMLEVVQVEMALVAILIFKVEQVVMVVMVMVHTLQVEQVDALSLVEEVLEWQIVQTLPMQKMVF